MPLSRRKRRQMTRVRVSAWANLEEAASSVADAVLALRDGGCPPDELGLLEEALARITDAQVALARYAGLTDRRRTASR